ncbi:MAG: hypothetical protein M3O34_10345 [Chloroflexota bacterium]|nr:hypothetical protein [Chloroflexota bacterium]
MLGHAMEHTVPILEAPDVLIQPKLGRLSSYHYHRWQRCVELGHEAAIAALPELLDVSRAAVEGDAGPPRIAAPVATPA